MTFKKAGLATLAATADAVTPRKYIKLLHHVYSTLEKHKQKLTLDVVKGLNELDKVVKEAAHTHSSAATGKLHYYLTEDVQVARLQSAAAALHKLISSTAKLSSYAAMDFKSSVIDAVNKLSSSKCALPANQLQLIEEFRNLTADLDPSADIPDGVHKAAEQVVRKVIDEVHGPFFNAEILDKELTHLEKAAQHLDPVTQHSEAACVKLLAGSLMLLDGNQGDDSDGDGDSLLEGSGGDPFSMPSFAAVLRVVDHDANKASSSSPNKLTIHLAGDDSATGANAASPMGSLTGGMDLPSPLASHSGAALSSPLGASQPHSQPASQQMQQLPKPAVKAAGAAGSSDETSTVSSSSNRPADMAAAAAAPHELLEDFMVSSSRSGITDGYKEARRACSFHAHMRLPREGVQKLAKFLETTPRVRGLSLAHNWIGPDGVQLLCQAMRVNNSVRKLDLPDNKLGDEGVAAIAQLLREGCNLTTIQLAQNGITDEGIAAFAQALEQNRTLEKLSVYANNIGSRGCQALTAAVQANPNLKVVEFLPGNCAPAKDIKALARAVKQNRKFKIRHLFGKQCIPG